MFTDVSVRSLYLRSLLVTVLCSPLSLSAITLTEAQIFTLIPLISGNPELLKDTAQGALVCQASKVLTTDLASTPLYAQLTTGCTPINPKEIEAEGTFFTDTACEAEILFKPTDLAAYCNASLDSEAFGNGALLDNATTLWEPAVATSLDIGVVPLEGNHQPYLTRVAYKTATTDKGDCSLEMRIYKKDIGATQLKPLIWFHGGSWRYRMTGVLGMESQLSHLTDLGFVVFTPFYRLLGDSEGTTQCNGASGEEILADASDAMTWVQENTTTYGASATKVYLTGQSAGGHLAAWLATHRPDEVERALLMYPPTDFKDFLAQNSQGELADTKGIDTLQDFIGKPLNDVASDDPMVVDNSFPQRIVKSPDQYPPMYIVHGASDEVVPVRQAARLCNALSGDIETGPARDVSADSSLALQLFRCDDRGSRLDVVTEANHSLEVCISAEVSSRLPLPEALCLSGSAEGQAATKRALQRARSWLVDDAPKTVVSTADSGERFPPVSDGEPEPEPEPETTPDSGGGGGSLAWLLLLSGLVLQRKHPVS